MEVSVSIRTRIEDAMIQHTIGRPEAALLSILTAVSATSRRRRPRGTPSERDPKRKMSDSEAFRLFLQDHMPKIAGAANFNVVFRGQMHPLERVLYKWLRCELAHDADLPSDIRFEPEPQPGRIKIAVEDSGLTLSHGLLDRLADVVITAPENADMFGSPPTPPTPIYLPKLDLTIGEPHAGTHSREEGSAST